MKYFSTRDKSLEFSFKDIFLRGLASDGGLFLPSEIKKYKITTFGEYDSKILLINKLISIIKKLTIINNNTKITIVKNA